MHGRRDCDHHRLKSAVGPLDHGYPLLAPRRGTCRKRNCQARKGNGFLNLNLKLFWNVLMRLIEKFNKINGGRTRTRTLDPLIKSYRVSDLMRFFESECDEFYRR